MLTGKLLLLPFTKIRFSRNLGVQFGATIWRYIFGGTCWGTILGYNLGVQFNENWGYDLREQFGVQNQGIDWGTISISLNFPMDLSTRDELHF